LKQLAASQQQALLDGFRVGHVILLTDGAQRSHASAATAIAINT
jgi:hypothetical protein